ncbi:hypothetical protein C8N36_12069 [Pelagimonas varians]|uniref:Uncharacterized protein n=1 Tax=Pelagimonas varians TaxID=696760 RepID=A0A238L2E7_9RHOB|nr:hypothetical protein C8N36_12069 [Pelagimonas varians]SMX49189.1 hypothetical protein PEV8663_04124 [Pelagimonas varians]
MTICLPILHNIDRSPLIDRSKPPAATIQHNSLNCFLCTKSTKGLQSRRRKITAANALNTVDAESAAISVSPAGALSPELDPRTTPSSFRGLSTWAAVSDQRQSYTSARIEKPSGLLTFAAVFKFCQRRLKQDFPSNFEQFSMR